MKKQERVVLIGASAKPDRYAYMALQLLTDYGHMVFPVNPRESEILGHTVYANVDAVPGPIDTVTLYVGPAKSKDLQAALCCLNPGRVIFNPGTENPALAENLRQAGILCIEACTLILLKTDQF